MADFQRIIFELTLEEKTKLVAGADFWTTCAIPRLGIPALRVSDGPNGARGASFAGDITSACFPASVSLAAAFDRDLALRIGRNLARESKSKGAHVLLGPTVCPHRDPRGGRNFESFSEDPYLAGELASCYVNGLQMEGVGASVKHFAANEQETRRFTTDVTVSQRALREIYLKPFEIVVKKSRPWTVMTSYNLVNGTHADASEFLINQVLRNEWGFKGLVMSDWGGTNTIVESLNAGLDLEMPGPGQFRTPANIEEATRTGKLSTQVLDQRVGALLQLLETAGKFAEPETVEEKAIDLPEHRRIIRDAGAEGMVLLKNDKAILPLSIDKVESIAMLGLAKDFLGHGGGSAAVNAHRKVTPYQAFEEAVTDKVKLNYAEGARIIRNLPPLTTDIFDEDGKPGLTARHWVRTEEQPRTRNVPSARFNAVDTPGTLAGHLTGIFRPKISGNHYISFCTVGETLVTINDEIVFEHAGNSADPMAMLLGVAPEDVKQFRFEAGEDYRIEITGRACSTDDTGISIFSDLTAYQLGFRLEADQQQEAHLMTPALEAASNSDVAIVFVGHTPAWETEGVDRVSMHLPKDGSLDKLIAATAKSNPSTIVVNSTGSPISMPWIDSVAAVIQAWFPGQEAGHAIADVVLGKVNPGGKLPVTFPKSIESAPSYGNFPGKSKDQVDYVEDIFVGYRHYDTRAEDVLFPFGFGLSYSEFEVSNPALSAQVLSEHGSIIVTANVTNIGPVAGSEVVQVYMGAESTAVARPTKELVGFAKVRLEPGHTQRVAVEIDGRNLAYWDELEERWTVDTGRYRLLVGTSSVHICSVLIFEVPVGFNFGP